MVRGTPPAAFLTTGQSHADPDQLLDALTGWTRTTADELPGPSRLLLRLLAAAEPEHRTSDMLKGVWTDLWRRLGRSSVPPPLSDTLAPLTAAALVEVEPAGDPGDPDRADRYNLHPGVADVICAGISPQTLTTIDNQLARFWVRLLDEGLREEEREATGGLVVHAALAAAPYLLRLKDWAVAGLLLEQALNRDRTLGTFAVVLPHLQAIGGIVKTCGSACHATC